MMSSSQLRSAFCDYFTDHGHALVPSAPLVPMGDPTILFTNAGMVQFKRVFLGEETRPFKRAVSVQKCVRAGGKHNDLENVGVTARHHTFFEMLGNFSFGDYFKKEAIEMGWEFLTRTLALPEERLWVSVFREDDEALTLWRDRIGLPAQRIIRLGEKDNFWQMGDMGPCGPCSEILFDQGPSVGCGRPTCGVGCDCDRYLEIWNLVFMQYQKTAEGTLIPLPKPSIDTGMGLERITAVVQGVVSNYDTDLFQPLIRAVSERTGRPYRRHEKDDISLRVIADHLRATVFLLSDGVLPSNEGRGYVLRRIIRRAARHGRLLGQEEPFLHGLTGACIDLMQGAYPAIRVSSDRLAKVLYHEEERFIHTLEQGGVHLQEALQRVQASGATVMAGEDVFRLYDTYGFPLDLIQEMAGDSGVGIDQDGFETALDRQRSLARKSWQGEGGDLGGKHGPNAEIYRDLAASGDYGTRFLGYDILRSPARVMGILRQGQRIREAREGDEVDVLFDQTPFYGESGGQVGDRGVGSGPHGAIEVTDTVKPSDLLIHRVRVVTGKIADDEVWNLEVARELRRGAARNHTATHLLHAALQEVLGDHVKQAGSLVTSDRLRFDFNHFLPVTPEERQYIEDLLNQKVMDNLPVDTTVMTLDAAQNSGATALFGEKYGDEVRVVRVADFSKELCGGTHCQATGEIGLFALIQETGIAAGVRRIEAVTGEAALRHIKEQANVLKGVSDLLKSRPAEVMARLEKVLGQVKDQEKDLERYKAKTSVSKAQELLSRVRHVDSVRVLSARVDGLEMKDLRGLADSVKEALGSGVLILGSEREGKVSLVAGVSKDLIGRYHAGNILQKIAPLVGGGGGGRPDMAQAGGKDPNGLNRALESIDAILQLPS